MYTFDFLELGLGGIAPCRHCVNPQLEPHTAKHILENLPQTENIILGGFEPFAHPELVNLLQSVDFAPFTRLAIQTDGGALASPQNAAGSLGAGVTLYEFLLRGGDSISHDQLTGRPGLFEAALKGIQNTRRIACEQNAEILIVGLASLCKHNKEQLLALVSAFVQAEVDAIRIDSQCKLDPELISAAYEIATPAGILLFGDDCTHCAGELFYHIKTPVGESHA